MLNNRNSHTHNRNNRGIMRRPHPPSTLATSNNRNAGIFNHNIRSTTRRPSPPTPPGLSQSHRQQQQQPVYNQSQRQSKSNKQYRQANGMPHKQQSSACGILNRNVTSTIDKDCFDEKAQGQSVSAESNIKGHTKSSAFDELQPVQAKYPRDNLIVDNEKNSLYVSTNWNDGERGIIEFDTRTNKIKKIHRYPNGMNTYCHSMGKYEHYLLLIDGSRNALWSFDQNSGLFAKYMDLPDEIGWHRSALMIGHTLYLHKWGTHIACQFVIDLKMRICRKHKNEMPKGYMLGSRPLVFNDCIHRFGRTYRTSDITETYDPLKKRRITLLGSNDKYLCALSKKSNYKVHCNGGSEINGTNKLWSIPVGDNKVRLLSHQNKYLVSNPSGQLEANSEKLHDWQIFEVVQDNLGIFGLRSCHGKWLSVQKNGDIDASGDSCSEYETFKISVFDNECFDVFWRSTAVSDMKNGKELKWTNIDSFCLPRAMNDFGCVLFGHHLIIFGGGNTGEHYDDIYVLNLHDNKGWQMSKVKCPMASCYNAVITSNGYIHLFTFGKNDKKHFGIAASKLIPQSNSEQNVELKKQWVKQSMDQMFAKQQKMSQIIEKLQAEKQINEQKICDLQLFELELLQKLKRKEALFEQQLKQKQDEMDRSETALWQKIEALDMQLQQKDIECNRLRQQLKSFHAMQPRLHNWNSDDFDDQKEGQ